MLVLARKQSQRILIGDDVVVTVVRVEGNTVRIGVEAPDRLPILRAELLCSRRRLSGEKPLTKPVYADFSENAV